jgi:hypothetical protein
MIKLPLVNIESGCRFTELFSCFSSYLNVAAAAAAGAEETRVEISPAAGSGTAAACHPGSLKTKKASIRCSYILYKVAKCTTTLFRALGETGNASTVYKLPVYTSLAVKAASA